MLEFVDFGGEGRRETWYAIVKEVITAYWFMGEYGPKQDDPMLPYMDGSKQGRKKAINSAINSIARLQVLIACSSFSLLEAHRALPSSFLIIISVTSESAMARAKITGDCMLLLLAIVHSRVP